MKYGHCLSGKMVYGTERMAKKSARILREKGRKNAHPYRCGTCKEWHVTTQVEIRSGHAKP